jgi:hypothetical protein
LGGILLFVGLAMAKYFFWDFDSSVESGSGRVVNLGLMADRQNGIILGVGLGTVGTIMLVIGFLSSGTRQGQPNVPKPHRAGTILALGIIGLFVFGPLCVAAWVMGNNDLHEMDAGTMDSRARSMTNSGRTLGIIGTILWIIGAIVLFLI